MSYFNKVTVDQIIPIQVSATTGYASFFTNAGQMTNKGLEVVLNGTPVKTKDFEWFVNLNVATLHNTVDEISISMTYSILRFKVLPLRYRLVPIRAKHTQLFMVRISKPMIKRNKLITPTGAGKGPYKS